MGPGDRPGALSQRAWLLLCVFREHGRVIFAYGDALNAVQRHEMTSRRVVSRADFHEALGELELEGYIEREGTKYVLSELGRGSDAGEGS